MGRSGVNKGKIDWQNELPKLREYIEDRKMTFEEVGEIYNKPKGQIEVICIRYGLKYAHRKVFSWSENEINTMRSLLLEGKSYQEISDQLPGRSKGAVRAMFEYHKEEFNLRKAPNKIIQNKISEEKMEEVKTLLLDGYSNQEITKISGIKYSGIEKVIKIFNISRPSLDELSDRGIYFIKEDRRLVRKTTDLTKEVLSESLNEGKSISEIAREFNLSLGYVSKFAHRLGWRDKKLEYSSKLKYSLLKESLKREPTKEELKQPFCNIFTEDTLLNLLKSTDFNINACGEELGIDPKGISQAIKRLGIILPETAKYKRSYGERVISGVLESFGIQYTHNFRLHKVIPNRTYVYIDFSLDYNGKTYWIEFNGKQHYFNDNSFTRSTEVFIDQVTRDRYVKELAEKRNVVFLEIPYTFNTYDKIYNLLQKVIIEGQNIGSLINYEPFMTEIKELKLVI